uniref:Uncharacterized protein n=1 Tax=Steinernema glaseri TaxID=37863 RepID=A0A1I8AQB1_9BILA
MLFHEFVTQAIRRRKKSAPPLLPPIRRRRKIGGSASSLSSDHESHPSPFARRGTRLRETLYRIRWDYHDHRISPTYPVRALYCGRIHQSSLVYTILYRF